MTPATGPRGAAAEKISPDSLRESALETEIEGGELSSSGTGGSATLSRDATAFVRCVCDRSHWSGVASCLEVGLGYPALSALDCIAHTTAMIYNDDVYQGGAMQVSKWGNSLAVRLPTAVVDALDLKEGDQIEIRIARERIFEVSRDQSKPQALARLRKLRRPLPPGFVFDREQANAR